METLNINDLNDNSVVKESIFNLVSVLPMKFPELIPQKETSVVVHESYHEMFFRFKGQTMLDNFIDRLEKYLDLYVLFATREDNGWKQNAVLYSKPVTGKMFVVNITSFQYGVIDAMTILFFDSVEVMYCYLLKERNTKTKLPYEILEEESYINTLSHFV
ncbi:MAG: hypothetical protein E6507_09770 [Prevotella bivia]|nr:hypothetical protein [Prevotella bivia]